LQIEFLNYNRIIYISAMIFDFQAEQIANSKKLLFPEQTLRIIYFNFDCNFSMINDSGIVNVQWVSFGMEIYY
jgi:hypothetical protein